MKKIIALMLALMLILTGTLALAENTVTAEPAAGAPIAFTLTDDLTINRDAVRQMLINMGGIEESQMEYVDMFIALLDALEQKLVYADGGIQYDLDLNGKNALSLGGEITEDGIALACTVIPSYVLTMKSDTISDLISQFAPAADSMNKLNELPAEAVEALQEYTGEFLETFNSAVTMGEPETVEYTYGDFAFNLKTPVNADTHAIAGAAKDLIEKVLADERIAPVIETLNASGAGIDPEFALPDDFAENVADVNIAIYNNVDESGNLSDDMCIATEFIPKGMTEPYAFLSGAFIGGECTVQFSIPESNLDIVMAFTSEDNVYNCQIDVHADATYFGLNFNLTMADDLVLITDVYVNDTENPILRETSTFSLNGERTLIVSDPDKKVLAIEDLLSGENSESILSSLGMDAMFNGLGGIITTVTEAVPELSNLEDIISQLMSGEAA